MPEKYLATVSLAAAATLLLILPMVIRAQPQDIPSQPTQELGLKAGAWVTTITTLTQRNLPPGLQGLLDRMQPERRAEVEQHLRWPPTAVSLRCTTREDLAKMFQPQNDRIKCHYSPKTSPPTQMEMAVDCENDQLQVSGTFHVEALDSGHIKGFVDLARTDSGAKASPTSPNSSFTFTSRWIGQVCPPTPVLPGLVK